MLERLGDLGDESLRQDDGLGHAVADERDRQTEEVLPVHGFGGPLGELGEGTLDVSCSAQGPELLEEAALLHDELLGDAKDPVVRDVPELDVLLGSLLGEAGVPVADLPEAGRAGPESDGGVDRAVHDKVGPSGNHAEEHQSVPRDNLLLGHEEATPDTLVLGWHKVGREVEHDVEPLHVQLPELLGLQLHRDETETLELVLHRLVDLVGVDVPIDDRFRVEKPLGFPDSAGALLKDLAQSMAVQSGHGNVAQLVIVANPLLGQALQDAGPVVVDLVLQEHEVLGRRKVPREDRLALLGEGGALGGDVESERVGEVVEEEGVAGGEEDAPQVPSGIGELLEHSLGTDHLLVLEVPGRPPHDVELALPLPEESALEDAGRMLREASTTATEIATRFEELLDRR